MNIDRVVVGVDGSPASRAALDWAVGLAGLCGAEVIVVHARGLLDRLHEGATAPAPPAATRWVERDGNPVEVLLEAAEHERADLVVVGSRGLGGYPELLLGSTSTQVAQHAPCPVVIIPAPPA